MGKAVRTDLEVVFVRPDDLLRLGVDEEVAILGADGTWRLLEVGLGSKEAGERGRGDTAAIHGSHFVERLRGRKDVGDVAAMAAAVDGVGEGHYRYWIGGAGEKWVGVDRKG